MGDRLTEGALVLEGGSLRGLFTAGVLDVLMEKGIHFSYVNGVSAGALNALNYISGQPGRTLKVDLGYLHDKRFMSFGNLIKKREIFSFEFLFGELSDTLLPFDYQTFVETEQEFEAVATRQQWADFIFKAAAVADYTPAGYSDDKLKKKDDELSIPLRRTRDILQHLGEHRRPGQVLCGFSMETRDMVPNSRAKLEKKNLDMICANNLKVAGAGFAGDTNVITIITPTGLEELPLMSKEEAAARILDAAVGLTH